MRVGPEEQEVGPGTLIFIPPGEQHAIRNVGDEPLLFISATAPPLDVPSLGTVFAFDPPPASS